jgi:hypothetical protein
MPIALQLVLKDVLHRLRHPFDSERCDYCGDLFRTGQLTRARHNGRYYAQCLACERLADFADTVFDAPLISGHAQR